MQYDAFIGQVQHRIQAPSRGDAEAASRALLETLGQRLPADLVDNLADALPHELARSLRTLEPLERLSLGEFFDRVSLREGVARPAAEAHAKAVVSVLEDALAASGILEKVRGALPLEYEPLIRGAGRHPGGEPGVPGGGAGRVEVARGSGVYRMSGPLPAGDAPVVSGGAWGQGERGVAGYEDHGESELHGEGLLGGEDEESLSDDSADRE